MKEESPQRNKTGAGKSKPKKPSRQLSLPSRVRKSFRHQVDRFLQTDVVWSMVFVIAVLLLLGASWFGSSYEDLKVGQIASWDVKALDDFSYENRSETAKRRREAREAVAPRYVHDVDRGESLAGQLSAMFRDGRLAMEQAEQAEQAEQDTVSESAAADAAKAALKDRIPDAALSVLTEQEFDPAVELKLTAALESVMGRPVVTNKASLEREAPIVLIRRRGGVEERVEQFERFVELIDARKQMRQELARQLELSRQAETALGELADSFVDVNVYFDRDETNRAKERAALEVQPAVYGMARGELLVQAGDSVTAEVADKFEAARMATGKPFGPRMWVGLLYVAALLAFFLYRYSHYHQRGFRRFEHLHALLVLMLVSMLALSEAILWLAWTVTDNLRPPFNQMDSYYYLIPLGAGAILVALLTNGRIATVYAAFCSLLFGTANGWDAYLILWAMLVQCAGVYAISTYRDRAALLRAGFVVGGTGAFAALAMEALQGSLEPWSSSLYAAALAFVGGAVGVGLVISFSLPLLEKLFNVLTDIRLLELSNLNNPLLSELAVKAPGSYNHSLVVGTLAEEGARAIGANSLFCRVAAFYHDVGKMNKPEYYVENQRGVNPHDRLSPSMSALIIASHVKDGIRMAREAGLPEQVVDIIPQHHGTKLMTYFYEKARRNADPSLGPVKEEDFRYPGPKPQTPEAAIFMLADAVEAAARTVDDPTPHRLKEMIRKVTNAIVVDDELDACDLTFSDLTKIQDAFLRCLVSMYHHRVDYPGFDFRRPKGDSGRAEAKTNGEVAERKVARSS